MGNNIISEATCLNGDGEEDLEFLFMTSVKLKEKYRDPCDSDCKKKMDKVEKDIDKAKADVVAAAARDEFCLV